jgi:hypothetical protein
MIVRPAKPVLCRFFAFSALAVVLAGSLSGCGLASDTSTGSTAFANVDGTVKVQEVHSPSKLSVDAHLTPGECHTTILNAAAGLVLPDPGCTPGAIDPAVTQANISSTICKKGWTATVRAPEDQTRAFKKISLAAYGQSYSRLTELDHFLPLELGGSNSVSNLWPEPNDATATSVNNPKDGVEDSLNHAVCRHQVTLKAAQYAMATNWTTAKQVLGLKGTH